MADDIKSKRVNIYIDQQAAESALVKLQAQADKFSASIAKGQAAGKSMVTELNKLSTVNDNIKKVQDQMDKGLKPSIQQQTTLVTQLRNELKRLSESDPQFAAKVENFKKQNSELQKMQANVNGVTTESDKLEKSFGNVLTRIGEYASIYVVFDKVKEFLTGSIEEANKSQEAIDGLKLSLENAGKSGALQPLLDQADQFAAKYKALDNDDVTRVFTKLVDYGKLSQDQITSLTDVIINFAAKQKISLEDSTDVITKALEGSAKGLKTYGINIKDASTVSERFGIIMSQLGPKVQGAESVFESSNQGFFAKLKQGFKDAEEAVGKFIYSLSGIEKAAFENAVAAKQEATTAQSLVDRYTELSSKVNQTTADKQELKNITAQLVGIFGSSVVSINKETGALQLNVQATKDLITQKLLLANDKASELAAQYNAALEGQKKATSDATINQTALTTATKQYGLSVDDIQKKLQYESLDALSAHEQEVYKIFLGYRNAKISLGDYGKQIDDISGKLKQLGFSKDDVNKLFNPVAPTDVLGNGNPNDDGGKAAKDLDEAAKKLEELKKQAQDFLKSLNDEDFLAKVPNDFQAIAEAAKKYFADIKTLTEDFNKGLIDVNQFQTGMAQVQEIYKDKIHDLQKNDNTVKVKVEVVPDAPAEAPFDFDKGYHAMGLPSRKEQEEIKDYTAKAQQLLTDVKINGLSEVSNAINAIAEQENANDQKRLDAIDVNTNAEKSKYQRLLGAKAISNQSYQQKLSELDKKAAADKEAIEKRQFERNKKAQLAQGIITGAQAVLQVLATVPKVIPGTIIPNPEFPIALFGTIATNAAEIGIIAAEHFAEGGKVLPSGKITANQNVPTQPGGDNVLAYVKRGEVILNEQQQRALGGADVFASIGVPGFSPQYLNRPYMAIDTSGITNNYTRLRYAAGGVVGSGTNGATGDAELKDLMAAVLDRLANQNTVPVVIQNDIPLNLITKAQQQLARIQLNATFK
jgi:hypothetical protein